MARSEFRVSVARQLSGRLRKLERRSCVLRMADRNGNAPPDDCLRGSGITDCRQKTEWEYACRGGADSTAFWWGDDFEDGEGRLNISAVDFLPGRNRIWPLANAPWSDGFAFVSPVDHYGDRGRNKFGMADMCGGVWEVVLDHFDPEGGHEEVYFVKENPRPVCRGGNYFDVPGNARCAVRLGLQGPGYSDSRDGFRICLGVPKE